MQQQFIVARLIVGESDTHYYAASNFDGVNSAKEEKREREREKDRGNEGGKKNFTTRSCKLSVAFNLTF